MFDIEDVYFEEDETLSFRLKPDKSLLETLPLEMSEKLENPGNKAEFYAHFDSRTGEWGCSCAIVDGNNRDVGDIAFKLPKAKMEAMKADVRQWCQETQGGTPSELASQFFRTPPPKM